MEKPSAPTGRHQRSVKNYLLDPAFQLKYTSYLVAIAVALSVALGGLLWRTSGEVLAESRLSVKQGEETVRQGSETVRRGQDLVKESQKLSAVVRMQIQKEYGDSPDLAKSFNEEADREQKRLEAEQQRLLAEHKRLEAEKASLAARAGQIEAQQRTIMTTLVTVLLALVVAIGLAGIMITHKIAGPIFKMKRQIRELGEGSLKMPSKLRKGDELVDFFQAFEDTVKSLRERQAKEIEQLDEAVKEAESGAHDACVSKLKKLRADMQAELA